MHVRSQVTLPIPLQDSSFILPTKINAQLPLEASPAPPLRQVPVHDSTDPVCHKPAQLGAFQETATISRTLSIYPSSSCGGVDRLETRRCRKSNEIPNLSPSFLLASFHVHRIFYLSS